MTIRFETLSGARRIDRAAWNRLARSAAPTMEWEYFTSLEDSGVINPGRGYNPAHLAVYQDQRLVGLAPMYQRDRAWVEFGDGGLISFLTELTGLPFHEGLVGTVPLTPVPGYQFLFDPEVDAMALVRPLLEYVDYLSQIKGLSTTRLYFVANEVGSPLHRLLMDLGYICLRSEYCLWFNRGYRDFDQFLGEFRSDRRHKIKHELRALRDRGIRLEMIDGTDAARDDYLLMHQLYRRTWTKHMGPQIEPFLNEEFFHLLSERFAHRCRLTIASNQDKRLAMAIFYHKGDHLYGRYWGAFEPVPFLHFATCYYQPIQYAIARGIRVMDPGFGGEHKLLRGFKVVQATHYIKFHGREQRRIAHSVLQRMQTSRPPEAVHR
ncbi:MAG: hypothetical protein AUK55_05835 [Syntrophobacteraceae bacterium CG2_30_61_12]|nr:MAG: hypothetical protein AUK55_05835 [Syntrophobacteraceae bacterium CG2_30_61_12]